MPRTVSTEAPCAATEELPVVGPVTLVPLTVPEVVAERSVRAPIQRRSTMSTGAEFGGADGVLAEGEEAGVMLVALTVAPVVMAAELASGVSWLSTPRM